MLLESSTEIVKGIDWAEIVKLSLVGLIAAFVSWLFTRRKLDSEIDKTQSDIEKNEADIIRTYVETVKTLQSEVDSWIAKVKLLRTSVSDSEDQTDEVKRQLKRVEIQHQTTIDFLSAAFKLEKERIIESVVKTIKIIETIQEQAHLYPQFNDLDREAIKLREMLYYIKTQLEKKSLAVPTVSPAL